MSAWQKYVRNNRFISFGLPFFVLIIGGSFGLRGFSQVRYDYRSQKSISREEVEDMGVKMKAGSEISMEKEYAKMQELDIDTWENKRGPRPWESDNTTNTKNVTPPTQKL